MALEPAAVALGQAIVLGQNVLLQLDRGAVHLGMRLGRFQVQVHDMQAHKWSCGSCSRTRCSLRGRQVGDTEPWHRWSNHRSCTSRGLHFHRSYRNWSHRAGARRLTEPQLHVESMSSIRTSALQSRQRPNPASRKSPASAPVPRALCAHVEAEAQGIRQHADNVPISSVRV